MIFHGRLSDPNYRCRRRPRYLIFSQFSIYYIVAKMRLPPGPCLGPHLGASSSPSWQTLGLTIAEGPTELRDPGPRDPTIRHCIDPIYLCKPGYVGVTFLVEKCHTGYSASHTCTTHGPSTEKVAILANASSFAGCASPCATRASSALDHRHQIIETPNIR